MSTKTLPKKPVKIEKERIVPAPIEDVDNELETPGEMEFSFAGVLSRHRVAKSGKRHTAYLRGSGLREFLRQVPNDSRVFGYKDIHYNDEFGSGDFYLAIDFGMRCGAIEKVTKGYQLVDRSAIIKAWNFGIDDLKFDS